MTASRQTDPGSVRPHVPEAVLFASEQHVDRAEMEIATYLRQGIEWPEDGEGGGDPTID